MTEAEYLALAPREWEPEFAHGELVERAMPDDFHSAVMANLTERLMRLARERGVFLRPERRVRVGSRFRVPDLLLFTTRPTTGVDTEAPLAVIEILSPGDDHAGVWNKSEEYAAWGAAHIWWLDPHRRTIEEYTPGRLEQVSSMALPELDAVLTGADCFEGLPD